MVALGNKIAARTHPCVRDASFSRNISASELLKYFDAPSVAGACSSRTSAAAPAPSTTSRRGAAAFRLPSRLPASPTHCQAYAAAEFRACTRSPD